MAIKKTTKRKLQAEKTKKKIFAAALELLEKRGMNNITIQDINKLAGISVGTFYHYYKSKEDVFFEIYRQADHYFETEVAPVLFGNNLTVKQQVVRYFGMYARFNVEKGLENVSQLYNTKNRLFIAKGRYMIELLQQIFSDGQSRGDVVDHMNPEQIADFLYVHARGIVFDWCLHDGQYDLEEKMKIHFEELVSVFLTHQ